MAITLPSAEELISFFGSEPHLADPGVPWAYNRVTFTCVLGEDRIQLAMSASYGEVHLVWRRLGQPHVELSLCEVAAVELEEVPSQACLRLKFDKPELGRLVLRLRPRVSLEWKMPAK